MQRFLHIAFVTELHNIVLDEPVSPFLHADLHPTSHEIFTVPIVSRTRKSKYPKQHTYTQILIDFILAKLFLSEHTLELLFIRVILLYDQLQVMVHVLLE